MSRSARAQKAAWHPELIKAQVRMREETLTSLAKKNGLAEDACRDALRTHRPAAEIVIATFIGVPKEKLWPDRYSDAASTDVDNVTSTDAHRQIVGAR